MDKPLLDRFWDGDINEDEFNAELDKLSPEQKSELEKQATEKKPTALDQLKALRKEKNRVAELAKANEGKVSAAEKFQQEQKEKARSRFFKEMGIKDEEQSQYDELFKQHPSEHVDAELIFQDMKRAYAFKHADQLLDAKKQKEEWEKNAQDFISQSAGPGPSGDGSGGKTYHALAHELVAKARKEGRSLTLDEAEKYLNKGLIRTY